MTQSSSRPWLTVAIAIVVMALSSIPHALHAQAQAQTRVTAFQQAVAVAAARDADIAAFYKSTGYQSLWTGRSHRERQRRVSLFKALNQSDNHGLPRARYDATSLEAKMKAARTPTERGAVEVELNLDVHFRTRCCRNILWFGGGDGRRIGCIGACVVSRDQNKAARFLLFKCLLKLFCRHFVGRLRVRGLSHGQ